MAGKPPIKKFNAGNIHSAVFENEGTDKDKNKFTFMTVQIQRGYTVADEKNPQERIWKNEIINARKSDLARLRIVIEEAEKFITLSGKDKEEASE